MNKSDLVNEVVKIVCTKKEAKTVVDFIFEIITKTLNKKDSVTLIGFGTFRWTREMPGRAETPKPVKRSRSEQRAYLNLWPTRLFRVLSIKQMKYFPWGEVIFTSL